MKRLVVVLLLLINITGAANAQKADTLQNASIQKIYDIVKAKGKPLILIDGIVYKANSKPFDIKDIASMEVLHPPGSVSIYGEKAVDGAITITTQKQMIDTGSITLPPIKKIDDYKPGAVHITQQEVGITDLEQLEKDSALFVLDGALSNRKLNGISPDEILSIDILKKDKASEIFESQAKNDIVVIVTKAAAVKSYQIKLSQFSTKYKAFLDLNHNNDSGVSYLIDRELNSPTKVDLLKALYDLKADDIIKVDFSPRSENAAGWKPAIVFITTKKY